MFENLQKELDRILTLGVTGSDMIVMKDGKEVFRHWQGYSDIENQIPMNGKERYNIYSCSKLITCTAALQLWEKGLFSLEDEVSRYLPEYGELFVKTKDGVKKAENPLLIEHLFSMTGGFHYDVHCPSIRKAIEETGGLAPTREVIRYLAKEPLLFEPGCGYFYSFSHDILACLVELLSGERFSEYVRKHIFEPLGMTRSTFALPEDEVENLCAQYEFTDGVRKRIDKHIKNFKFGSEYESGGAGCISSLEDYIRFLEAIRVGDVILKKDTIAMMATNRLTKPEQYENYYDHIWHQRGYGLGVRCPADPNDTISEFGWSGAAGAFYSIDPKNGFTFYYAQHAICSPFDSWNIELAVRKDLGLD